jgi:GNAT superfamily N-acetyltransferase
VIRGLRADDAGALAAMMARCSPRTRYQRFHGVVTEIPPAYLRRCLDGEHLALVAESDTDTGWDLATGTLAGKDTAIGPAAGTGTGTGTDASIGSGLGTVITSSSIVGLASVGPVFEEPDVAEVAVIVEDRWQGQGIGRALVAALVAKAGVTVVRMELCRTPLLTYVTEALPVVASRQHGCDVTIDVDVRSLAR